jgi:5-methylcytosine-specific restriction protein A
MKPTKPKNFLPKHSKNTGRKLNSRRDIDRLYDNDWQRYRARFLAANSKCYACGAPAVVVDHLIPHKGDEILFRKLDNHIPMCYSDHNYVTTKFDRDYVRGSSIEAKVLWLNSRRVGGDWKPQRVKVLRYYK